MPDASHILVIDDEESIRFAFTRYFQSRGHHVSSAATAREGLAAYKRNRADVVFLDVRLPDASGLDVLEKLRAGDPDAVVVVMTAYGTLETVTRAIRGKAFDYLVKPLDLDRAADLVAQAAASRQASTERARHGAAAGARAGPSPAPAEANRAKGETPKETVLVGSSPAMQEVYKRIGLVAQSDAAVLIRGDTGTGKELVARAIHEHSGRAGQPFVPVNCGALPDNLVESELFGYVRGAFTGADGDKPGRFELADGGTLFLDEVGELPLAAQVKLLRFLDEQIVERLGSVRAVKLDVRILAATNRDLARAIQAQRFRDDLFYRLAVIQVELPPLAERVEDILPLARHFLSQRFGASAPPISEPAADALKRYRWPGNVRELRNAIDHAAVVSGGGPLLPTHLPELVRLGQSPRQVGDDESADCLTEYVRALLDGGTGDLHRRAVEPLERELIRRALEQTNGNQTAAAGLLGLHRNTLRNKLRELGME
jgi:DNA-binding NtrC family response regulator